MKPYAGSLEHNSSFNLIRSASFIPKNLDEYHEKVNGGIEKYEINSKAKVSVFDPQILTVIGH